MSTLWTPGGERPIRREPEASQGAAAAPPGAGRRPDQPELTESEMAEQMAELRDQLARTPAEVVVANHAYGLFELAALHLSLERPQLEQARLAIDALGYLVEGMGARLGAQAEELGTGLAQLRMAYVQISGAARTDSPSGPGAGPGAGGQERPSGSPGEG